MRSLLLSMLIALIVVQPTEAQSFMLKKTQYVGALPAELEQDWTRHWTNWTPQNTDYPSPDDTLTLNGMLPSFPRQGEKRIYDHLTLDPKKTYLLKGIIVVEDGATLTIPAGTIIRCLADLKTNPKNYATLLIQRGGKIEITGTSDAPVIFTSAKSPGARNRGDWGGLVICGNAPHNQFTPGKSAQIEGFNKVSFDPLLALVGGDQVNDNSGILRYLRIEYSGVDLELAQEINGLTLGAVGSGTEINHVQVSFANDDSFEWIGGTVNASHLISYKTTDDDFDTSFGYSGLNQFGIALRDPEYYDYVYPNVDGIFSSEGFESDNENSGSLSAKSVTNAVFSNFTMIGPIPVGSSYKQVQNTLSRMFRRGALIRRNSSLRIVNSIFMGYRNFVMIAGDSCIRNTNYPSALDLVQPNSPVDVKNKQLFFSNNLIVNTDSAYQSASDVMANGLAEVSISPNSQLKLMAIDSWLRQPGPLANNIDPVPFEHQTVLIEPLSASDHPDFRPIPGSPALSGANFNDHPLLQHLVTSTAEFSGDITVLNPVYPNPIQAHSELIFGRMVESFRIFDLNGRLLRYGSDVDRVLLNGLDAGMYIIKFYNNTQRFIVK